MPPKRRQAPNPSGRAKKAQKSSAKAAAPIKKPRGRPRKNANGSSPASQKPTKIESLAANLHRMLPDKEELNHLTDTHLPLVAKAVDKAVPSFGLNISDIIARYALSRVDLAKEKGTVEELYVLEQRAQYFLSYWTFNERVREMSQEFRGKRRRECFDKLRPMLNRMLLRNVDTTSDDKSAEFQIRSRSHQSPPTSLEHCNLSIRIDMDATATTIDVEAYWNKGDREKALKSSDMQCVARVRLYSALLDPLLSTKVFDQLADLLDLPEWFSAEEFILLLAAPLDSEFRARFETVDELPAESGEFDTYGLFGLTNVARENKESHAPAEVKSDDAASESSERGDQAESLDGDDVKMGAAEEKAQAKGRKRITMAGRMLKRMDEADPSMRLFDTRQAVFEFLPLQSVAGIVADYAFDATEVLNHLGCAELLDRLMQSSAEFAAYSRLIRAASERGQDLIHMVDRLYVEEVRPEYRATNYLLLAPPDDHLENDPNDPYFNCEVVISVMFDLKRWMVPSIRVRFEPDPLNLSGRILDSEMRPKPRVCRVLGRRLGVPAKYKTSWVSLLTSVTPYPWEAEESSSEDEDGDDEKADEKKEEGEEEEAEEEDENEGDDEDEEDYGSGCTLNLDRKSNQPTWAWVVGFAG